MATNYPASVDNGTTLPNPSASQDTNSPSLSSGQGNQNDAIIALENKLGTGSSSPAGTYALVSTGTGTSAWSLATPTSAIVGINDTQTLTNKTIDASNNTITNLSGVNIGNNTAVYTPSVSSGTGTLTSASATGRYWQIGKLVTVSIIVTITTNGTGATAIIVSLPPIAPYSTGTLFGRETAIGGKSLNGNIASSTTAQILNYDNTYPGSSGAILNTVLIYEAA